MKKKSKMKWHVFLRHSVGYKCIRRLVASRKRFCKLTEPASLLAELLLVFFWTEFSAILYFCIKFLCHVFCSVQVLLCCLLFHSSISQTSGVSISRMLLTFLSTFLLYSRSTWWALYQVTHHCLCTYRLAGMCS